MDIFGWVGGEKSLDLGIEAPPCNDCRYFRPQAIFEPAKDGIGWEYARTRSCWAEEMYNDFSCFTTSIAGEQKKKLELDIKYGNLGKGCSTHKN